MKDYSQYGEQAAILRALEGIDSSEGRLLDIGAWHPETFSNSRALIEAGWSAVLIEPSPRPVLDLLGAYGGAFKIGEWPRREIKVLSAAIGLESGYQTMKISDDGLSTADVQHYETWRDKTSWHGELLVPSVTLSDISTWFGHFHFWSIDAEGLSADLFLLALRLGYSPQCFCVEHDGRQGELIMRATESGYVVTLANHTNLVMVKS